MKHYFYWSFIQLAKYSLEHRIFQYNLYTFTNSFIKFALELIGKRFWVLYLMFYWKKKNFKYANNSVKSVLSISCLKATLLSTYMSRLLFDLNLNLFYGLDFNYYIKNKTFKEQLIVKQFKYISIYIKNIAFNNKAAFCT